jgi:hypothetical protein
LKEEGQTDKKEDSISSKNILKKRHLKYLLYITIPLTIIYLIIETFNFGNTIIEVIISIIVRIFFFFQIATLILLFKGLIISSKVYILNFLATLTIKKSLFLLTTGLIKRYIIDNIIVKHLNDNLLKHLIEPVKKLVFHIKDSYLELNLKNKVKSTLLLLLPAVVVGYLMYVFGFVGMLINKIFSAQIWKNLLIFIIKIGTSLIVFFETHILNSWIMPIIEILMFTWLLEWLEKIPYFGGRIKKLYIYFRFLFVNLKWFIHRYVNRPIKRVLKNFINKVERKIDKIVGD